MENLQDNQPETQPQTANREIRLSELAAYVEAGKKREDIMQIYGLKDLQVTKLMKEAGLQFRKFQKPAFTLIRDIEIPQARVSQEETPETPAQDIPENNASQNQEVIGDNWS